MKKEKRLKILRVLSVLALAAALVAVCIFARSLRVEDILRYTPDNPLLALLALTLMTAAASMIPVFPMMLFYFAGGILFSFWGALFSGAAGILAAASLQYAVGRRMGSGYVDTLIEKHPKLVKVRTWQVNNDVFLTYLLRISGLPVNMVSVFIGAMGIRFPAYLLGTYIGMIPGLISCVLIGYQVKDSFSWQLIAAVVLINAASFVVAFLYNRCASRKKGK